MVLGWFKCITFLVHFISIILTFLLFHLRSSGIRSQRLGAPALLDCEDILGGSNNLDVFFALCWVSTWETKTEDGCCEGCGCEKDGDVKIRVSATNIWDLPPARKTLVKHYPRPPSTLSSEILWNVFNLRAPYAPRNVFHIPQFLAKKGEDVDLVGLQVVWTNNQKELWV